MINIILIGLLLNLLIIYFKKVKINIIGCGLIGFSGEDDFNIDKIKMLMLANVLRGKHSTGIYNNGKITKKAEDSISFLSSHKLYPEKIFIGHDRFATIGLKIQDNAHPFEYNNIILAHNGTLINHWQLCRDYGLEYTDYNVDSQVLTKLISLQKENYKVLSEFEGAAALIWTDRDNPNRIYCFRNNDRPLFYGHSEEGLYISSIESSLKIIGCNKIKSFKTNFVYAIEFGKIIIKESKRIIKKKEKVLYNNYLPTAVSSSEELVMSSWVKCKTTYSTASLTINKSYKIVSVPSNKKYLIVDDNRIEQVYSEFLFYERASFVLGDFLISMENSSNGLIKKGFLYNLTEVEKESNFNLLVLSDVISEKTYTWTTDHFRIATEHEILKVYKDQDSQLKLELKDKELDKSINNDLKIYGDEPFGHENYFAISGDLENGLIDLSNEFKTVKSSVQEIIDSVKKEENFGDGPIYNLMIEIEDFKASLDDFFGSFDNLLD